MDGKIIFVNLHGGFGNQLFQIALAKRIQLEFNVCPYLHDTRGNTHSSRDYRTLFPSFETDARPVPHLSCEPEHIQLDWDAFYEPTMRQQRSPMPLRFTGYYQNWKNVVPVLEDLRTELLGSLEREGACPPNPELYAQTAFLHVRRGDYLTKPYIHWVQPLEYFRSGMDRLRALGVRHWLVASDDLAWCRQQDWQLQEGETVEFLDEPDELKTFAILQACKAGAVISNSTFSWWGAVLGAHSAGAPIVAPSQWYEFTKPNLFPDGWIVLEPEGRP